MIWLMIGLGVLALAVGIWIGIGAPGWPHKDTDGRRRHRSTRPLNPIAWGRSGSDHRAHRRRG